MMLSTQSAATAPAAVPAAFAQPAYRPRRRGPGFALRQYMGLVQVLLTEYRSTWLIYVLFGGLMPLGMLFLFKYAGMDISPEKAVFLIGGNLTTAVVFGPTMMLINKIGWGRENRTFDYWAALPIGKLTLVLAFVSVSLLFALPGAATVFLAGGAMLGVPLARGLWLIPLLPLGSLSLSGLGAFLGACAKDGQTANNYANIVMSVVIFLSPMMMPQDVMPLPLRLFSYAMPTTYVADSFRAVLAGRFGMSLGLDVLLLILFTAAMLLLVHRKLDWRAD
ncbi:MAG: ABC transporter permease [Symbiobacteriia bacterium]